MNIKIGNWDVYRDSPEFGCSDNPSFKWFAMEYINGHWTGKSMEAESLADMREKLS